MPLGLGKNYLRRFFIQFIKGQQTYNTNKNTRSNPTIKQPISAMKNDDHYIHPPKSKKFQLELA